jgi:hypothetical protein
LGVAGACAVIAGGLLKMPIYAYLGASAIALAAAFVAVMWSRGVTGAIGAAGDPLEEIRLRARKYLRSHWENTQSQNPFARLAAALKARDEWPEHADIVSLIRSESNFIVRRELFRSLSSAPPDTLLACFQALCDDVDARYLVEAVVRAFPSELPPQITARIDAPMSTLFAIYGHTPWRSSDLAYCLAARQTPDHETTLICRAYDGGGERAIESAARHVSLARLEAAETQLSPLLISGLGSLDGLSRARQIEDYYVFFRQLRFMREPNREVAVAETERRLVVSSS